MKNMKIKQIIKFILSFFFWYITIVLIESLELGIILSLTYGVFSSIANFKNNSSRNNIALCIVSSVMTFIQCTIRPVLIFLNLSDGGLPISIYLFGFTGLLKKYLSDILTKGRLSKVDKTFYVVVFITIMITSMQASVIEQYSNNLLNIIIPPTIAVSELSTCNFIEIDVLGYFIEITIKKFSYSIITLFLKYFIEGKNVNYITEGTYKKDLIKELQGYYFGPVYKIHEKVREILRNDKC